MISVRYGLPLVIFLLGCVLLLLDKGGLSGWEGFFMATGAALAVLFLNVLYRLGAEGDREREAEEEAREYFARTGHWPDEEPPDAPAAEGPAAGPGAGPARRGA